MANVSLFYRDADNYKCRWDVQVPDEVMRNLPEPDNEGMYDIRCLGLTVDDIPLVQGFGYVEESDHPFVTIEDYSLDEEKGRESR